MSTNTLNKPVKLKDAISAIENEQAEAHQVDLARKRKALDDIAPTIALLQHTFKEDDLKGWNTPVYCSGVAYTRFWLEGKCSTVYLKVDSRCPERVVVYRQNGDLGTNTFPTTDEGLAHMLKCVAKRMTLWCD